MYGMKLLIHSQTPTVQPLKFTIGYKISYHTWQGMWLPIHPEINVIPCYYKGTMVYSFTVHGAVIFIACRILQANDLSVISIPTSLSRHITSFNAQYPKTIAHSFSLTYCTVWKIAGDFMLSIWSYLSGILHWHKGNRMSLLYFVFKR